MYHPDQQRDKNGMWVIEGGMNNAEIVRHSNEISIPVLNAVKFAHGIRLEEGLISHQGMVSSGADPHTRVPFGEHHISEAVQRGLLHYNKELDSYEATPMGARVLKARKMYPKPPRK